MKNFSNVSRADCSADFGWLTRCFAWQSLFLTAGASRRRQTICGLTLPHYYISLHCPALFFPALHAALHWLKKDKGARRLAMCFRDRSRMKQKKNKKQWNKMYSICSHSLDCSQRFVWDLSVVSRKLLFYVELVYLHCRWNSFWRDLSWHELRTSDVLHHNLPEG